MLFTQPLLHQRDYTSLPFFSLHHFDFITVVPKFFCLQFHSLSSADRSLHMRADSLEEAAHRYLNEHKVENVFRYFQSTVTNGSKGGAKGDKGFKDEEEEEEEVEGIPRKTTEGGKEPNAQPGVLGSAVSLWNYPRLN